MKLKEFLTNLNDLIKKNPEIAELECYTSIDDEGNGYIPVYFSPSVGIIDDGDFIDPEDSDDKPNAIVLN